METANGPTWKIVRHGLLALAFTLALAGNSIAGGLTAGASAGVISTRASFLPALSICKGDRCAWSASALGGTKGVALTNISKFDTPLEWQSGFSVAGSRVWSKFIIFSRTGVNVRLPLN